MAAHSAAGYRWQAPAMLRAVTGPGPGSGPAELPDPPDLDDAPAVRAWLRRIWCERQFREAVRAAAPVLAEAVEDVVGGQQLPPRRIRRTALSVLSYLLRWQHRPTPLGLFAGIAALAVGDAPRVQWGGKHGVVLRADAEWVTDVILRLQAVPELLRRLPVVANNTAHRRGDRLVAVGPPADAYATLMAPVEVSVRLTRPVAAAVEAARRPIVYADLRDHLHALFPTAGADQVDRLLGELLDQQILLTSLWAPMTITDAFGHLCSELERASAHAVPGLGGMVSDLLAIRDEIAAAAPARVTTRMHALSRATPTPLNIDTALDCEVQLPAAVLEEAEAAVAALYRTTPHPYGYQHWRDYHRRFRMRYGVGAHVPVLELVSDSGLGLPAGFLGSERGRPPRLLTDRDETLLALLQPVLMEGRGELLLTDTVIGALADAAGTEPHFVPRVEAAFEVHAPSTADLARGAFEIVLTAAPRPGSSMAGRFAHLLDPGQQKALAAGYRADPEAVTAQLSFAPRRRRNENVARTPRLLDHFVSVGEHPAVGGGGTAGGETIGLDDIAVTADARHFRLVQISTGRRLDIRVLHALEAGTQTPVLPRFLAEIAEARYAAYQPFDFGAAARLPYLPRVRYRRTILAPARWLLAANDLPRRTAAQDAWERAFDLWRARLQVPHGVSVVEHDQRLTLDLTRPAHRQLLRARLDLKEHLELREAPAAEAYGWIGRAHEVWVSLHNTAPPADTHEATAVRNTHDHDAARAVRTGPAPLHLPGDGTVLHARLRAHPARYDEILTRHLPPLLGAFGDRLTLWWFTRHRQTARPDADQYLDLVLHLAPGTYASAARDLRSWADALHCGALASGLLLADYRPQTGVFGHEETMDAAHRVFAADSAAALAQIRLTDRTDAAAPQALAAASAFDLVQRLAHTETQGTDWLVQRLPRTTGRLEPLLRDQVLDLSSAGGPEILRALPGGDAVVDAWQVRAAALGDYRHRLTDADPLRAARTLLHQHHVRALGVDPTAEALTLRLARTAALRRQKAAQ